MKERVVNMRASKASIDEKRGCKTESKRHTTKMRERERERCALKEKQRNRIVAQEGGGGRGGGGGERDGKRHGGERRDNNDARVRGVNSCTPAKHSLPRTIEVLGWKSVPI